VNVVAANHFAAHYPCAAAMPLHTSLFRTIHAPLWLFVCMLGMSTGCWTQPEEPAPLPIPVADPQILERPAPPLAAGDFAAVRQFRFYYDVKLTELKPGEQARIWVPLAIDNSHQRVKREQTTVPGEVQEMIAADQRHQWVYTEAVANEQGEIPLLVQYLVERVEALPGAGEKITEPASSNSPSKISLPVELDTAMKAWSKSLPAASDLPADKYVREIWEKMDDWFQTNPDPSPLVAAFVLMCKERNIPADAEWGFIIDREDKWPAYAAGWAKYAVDGRWHFADVQAGMMDPEVTVETLGTLSADRIGFTDGLSVSLIPAPAEKDPIEKFVLPYVEVAGKPHDKWQTNFRYEDASGESPQ